MLELKIDKVSYKYPNLIFSLNDQTWSIRVKDKRGKKWLKIENLEGVYFYPAIENDITEFYHQAPIRDMVRFMKDILNNFPTRMDNTNESARNFIWGWRNGMFEDKSGVLGS